MCLQEEEEISAEALPDRLMGKEVEIMEAEVPQGHPARRSEVVEMEANHLGHRAHRWEEEDRIIHIPELPVVVEVEALLADQRQCERCNRCTRTMRRMWR